MPKVAINGIRHSSKVVQRYLSYELPDGGRVKLPLVNVRIRHNDRSFTTIGLIDSGATQTFIPRGLSELLYLSSLGPDKVSTAGGDVVYQLSRIDELSLLFHSNATATFSDVSVEFPSQGIDDLPYVVLGRNYVFDSFRICFDEAEKRTTFKRALS